MPRTASDGARTRLDPARTSAAPMVGQRRWVRRTLRRFDVKTVFKFSLVFYLALFVTFLVTGILLWVVATLAGLVHSFEHLIQTLFGYQSFKFVGSKVLVAYVLGGAVLVVLASLLNVLAAVVYNLVSDVVGGVHVVVEEDDPARRPVV